MGQGGGAGGEESRKFLPTTLPVSGQKAEMVSPLRWTLWVTKNGAHGEKHIKSHLPADDSHIQCALRKQVGEDGLVNSQTCGTDGVRHVRRDTGNKPNLTHTCSHGCTPAHTGAHSYAAPTFGALVPVLASVALQGHELLDSGRQSAPTQRHFLRLLKPEGCCGLRGAAPGASTRQVAGLGLLVWALSSGDSWADSSPGSGGQEKAPAALFSPNPLQLALCRPSQHAPCQAGGQGRPPRYPAEAKSALRGAGATFISRALCAQVPSLVTQQRSLCLPVISGLCLSISH